MPSGEEDALSRLVTAAVDPWKRTDKHHLNQGLLALEGKHTDLLPNEQFRCRIPVSEGEIKTAVSEDGAVTVGGLDDSGMHQLFVAAPDSTRFTPVLKQPVGEIRAVCFPSGSNRPACVAGDDFDSWRVIWDDWEAVFSVPVRTYLNPFATQQCWLTCWMEDGQKNAFIMTYGMSEMLTKKPDGTVRITHYPKGGARVIGVFDGSAVVMPDRRLNKPITYGDFTLPKTSDFNRHHVQAHPEGGIIMVGFDLDSTTSPSNFIATSFNRSIRYVEQGGLFLVNGEVYSNHLTGNDPHNRQNTVVSLDGSWQTKSSIAGIAVQGFRYGDGSLAVTTGRLESQVLCLFDRDGNSTFEYRIGSGHFTPDGRLLFPGGWYYPQTFAGMEESMRRTLTIMPIRLGQRSLHQMTLINENELMGIHPVGNGQLAVHRWLPMDPDVDLTVE
ncbi:MAG: hypothetical protein ABIG66_02465 [Candidatus Kerfeldbacteria bacterium]